MSGGYFYLGCSTSRAALGVNFEKRTINENKEECKENKELGFFYFSIGNYRLRSTTVRWENIPSKTAGSRTVTVVESVY